MNPLDLITGNVWKAAAIGAGVVIVGLGITIAVIDLDRAHLRSEVADLTDKIENPQTGYIARLTQAQANVATLKAGLDEQNAKVEAQAAEAKARIAATEKRLVDAQAAAASAKTTLARLMATPLIGKDVCARLSDADRRLLETLK